MEAINTIMENKDKYRKEQVMENPVIYYGFVKLIEIIGEAVYMLTPDFKASHTEVAWRQIERMRHVLVHGYYTINPVDLWQTVVVDIPTLKPQIDKILSEMP